MPIEMDILDFVVAQKKTVGEGSNFRHKVVRGTLKGDERYWIRKEISSPMSARIELLAQEFFRFLIPHQPETRLAVDKTSGVHYILSEEILGFRHFPENEPDKFQKGIYTGLGSAVLLAFFIEEIDLKRDNIGIDLQGRVIKIDGDWCFGAITHKEGDYPITAEILKKLPNPSGFYTYNWLDYVFKETNEVPAALNETFNTTPQFCSEFNKTLLKLSLIPDVYFQAFTDNYISSGGQRFVDFFNNRSHALKRCALQLPSFVNYLASQEAKDEAESFYEHMASFIVSGGTSLLSENQLARLRVEFGLVRDALFNLRDSQKPKEFSLKVPAPVTYVLGSQGLDLHEYSQKNAPKVRFFKEGTEPNKYAKYKMVEMDEHIESKLFSDIYERQSQDWKRRVIYKKSKDTVQLICPSPK